MTEQERLDWEVSQTKSQIKYYRNETEATQDRIISKFEHILSTQDAQLETLYRQGERINNIDNHVGKTGMCWELVAFLCPDLTTMRS